MIKKIIASLLLSLLCSCQFTNPFEDQFSSDFSFNDSGRGFEGSDSTSLIPTISNPSPSGSISSDISLITISVDTNKKSSCRYSKEDLDFDDLESSLQSNSSGLSHIALVNLSAQTFYKFYVRCRDINSGKATKEPRIIEFSTMESGDTTAPVIVDVRPKSSVFASSTKTVSISATTNEEASCRYSEGNKPYQLADKSFETSNKLTHTASVDIARVGEHLYFVHCSDPFGNITKIPSQISFYVEEEVVVKIPVISNITPRGSIKDNVPSVTLSANTDIEASCRYDSVDRTYNLMTYSLRPSSDRKTHTGSYSIRPLQEYKLYIRCQSLAGVANDKSEQALFNTKDIDVEPPVISNLLPGGTLPSDQTSAQLRVSTDEAAQCKYDTQNLTYAGMRNSFDGDGSRQSHSKAVSNLVPDTQYRFYVACIDDEGNASTNNPQITFRVDEVRDLVAPVLSEFRPFGELGEDTTKVTLSLKTNEPAFCRYSDDESTSFGDMSEFTVTGNQSHNSEVTGIESGQSYNYFVYCEDESENISALGEINFSVKEKEVVVFDGELLYNQNCATCHDSLDISNLRGRPQDTGIEYEAGINRIGAMAFLRGKLSVEQLDAIAAVVNQEVEPPSPNPPANGTEENERKYLIGTRRYISSKFTQIFYEQDKDEAVLNIINENIIEDVNGNFGGNCTITDSNCHGTAQVKSSGLMIPNSHPTRSAIVYNTCQQVLDRSRAVNSALAVSNLTINSNGNSNANINALADTFYPGMELDQEQVDALKYLYSKSKDEGLSNANAWKMVMDPMCKSALFEAF